MILKYNSLWPNSGAGNRKDSGTKKCECADDTAGERQNESAMDKTLLIIIASGEIAGLYFP